jgi:hypothetical protein
MAKSKVAAPETIWGRLSDPIRTSTGDPPPDLLVELPGDEFRELERQGLVTRVEVAS